MLTSFPGGDLDSDRLMLFGGRGGGDDDACVVDAWHRNGPARRCFVCTASSLEVGFRSNPLPSVQSLEVGSSAKMVETTVLRCGFGAMRWGGDR